MAGISNALRAYTSCLSSFISNPWIIDSGAAHHMTFDKSKLHNIKFLSNYVSVTLPNSYKVKVNCMGDVSLTSHIKLKMFSMFLPSNIIYYQLVNLSRKLI